MKSALIAVIVGMAVATGTALATNGTSGHPRASNVPPPPPAGHPSSPAAPKPRGALNPRSLEKLVGKWSAAHPGWENPARMTHQESLQAAVSHPAVYAPQLMSRAEAVRILEQYGPWATMSPHLRALERKQGIPIPFGIPYVPPSVLIPSGTLHRLDAAREAAARP
ncbi:MAG TPA: hypothetical protein VKR79_08970 [Gaiellaceae bacterium]|nr:hypothetical protein [Gaiellaceae bacterium]